MRRICCDALCASERRKTQASRDAVFSLSLSVDYSSCIIIINTRRACFSSFAMRVSLSPSLASDRYQPRFALVHPFFCTTSAFSTCELLVTRKRAYFSRSLAVIYLMIEETLGLVNSKKEKGGKVFLGESSLLGASDEKKSMLLIV